jgi:hypothetical protein
MHFSHKGKPSIKSAVPTATEQNMQAAFLEILISTILLRAHT